MPWSTSRPRGASTAAKYRDPAYLAAREALRQQMAATGRLTCAQPNCLEPSRAITPGMAWHTGHDDTGTRVIGPVHRRCNVVDGAKRGRARQNVSRLRW